MGTGAELLCQRVHPAFQELTDAVINLKFEEEPPYQRFMSMFEPLLNVPEHPLQVEMPPSKVRGQEGRGQWGNCGRRGRKGRETYEQRPLQVGMPLIHACSSSPKLFTLCLNHPNPMPEPSKPYAYDLSGSPSSSSSPPPHTHTHTTTWAQVGQERGRSQSGPADVDPSGCPFAPAPPHPHTPTPPLGRRSARSVGVPSLVRLMWTLPAALSPPHPHTTTWAQVGQKRGRSQFDPADADAPAVVKRVRSGQAAQQWITVHTRAPPMKQRYHYNVSTQRLLVHVQKGWEDSLFVTSVASCDDLWAIVMDAGTEYTQQIYKVHPNSFLPKEWIMEKWEEGFYITSVAGSDSNNSLVVMSKGARFSQQSYKVLGGVGGRLEAWA
eukprot:359575-Chlamydomonas_euryale.AAC.1